MTFTLPDNDEAFNNNQSIWMQTDINALIAGIQGDGVVSGCAVSEDGGGASMDLDITSGTIQISDTAYSITGSVAAVTISTADASNPRIDLVSAKNDDTLNVTAGTPAANPKAPDIPASSVLLAMVYVPANDTTIADNQITDKRVTVREVVATTTTTIQIQEVLYSETLASAGNFDISSIDQSYDHLLIRAVLRSSSSTDTDNGEMFFNNDTTDANYYRAIHSLFGGTPGGAEQNNPQISGILGNTAPANNYSQYEVMILNYAGSHNKQITSHITARDAVSNAYLGLAGAFWESTAAINRITIQPDGYSTDKFVAGSYLELIGIKEQSVLIAS